MATVVFQSGLSKRDPAVSPVLIIGQVKHLTQIQYNDVKTKLEPRVSAETLKEAINTLHPSPTDTRSLWINRAYVAALPLKCSRHNTPSRAHFITKIVQTLITGELCETVVIVCEERHLYASACAVARACPLFTRKTNLPVLHESIKQTVTVEFLIVPGEAGPPEPGRLTDEDLKCLDYATAGIQLAARIVDTPCNEMTVDDFVKEVEAVGAALKITPTIVRGEELKRRGFGGIYGVGRGAQVPPALAVLSHTPDGATQTVAWVGKGIVYDTGGLSIKGKTAMPGMKRDCGGAAAILGAFYAAVKSGFSENLHAVFCLAENAVGPNSIRPDDILTLYSGRTVEINNTDAEGRLVLSDGVVYASRDLKANIILDMATLTGAQGISTGKYHGAVLTNNGDWERTLMNAGTVSGDLVFPLPYCPELHISEFNSAVADMKNSVADRSNAQASCAGLFIASHLGFDYPGVWVHVDMAYPVHSGERATGYGVALLTTLFGSYTTQNMLQSIAPAIPAGMENASRK